MKSHYSIQQSGIVIQIVPIVKKQYFMLSEQCKGKYSYVDKLIINVSKIRKVPFVTRGYVQQNLPPKQGPISLKPAPGERIEAVVGHCNVLVPCFEGGNPKFEGRWCRSKGDSNTGL